MLKPNYLEQLPDPMIGLYSQVEQDILADLARRIATYNYWIPAADWQYQKLIEMGNYHNFVLSALSAQTGKTTAELTRMMQEAGAKTLAFDAGIYQAQGLTVPPLAASVAMQKILAGGLKSTSGEFKNLTRTTANTATKQFEDALDRVWLQVTSGGFDLNTAVRRAVKDLSKEGLQAIRYPTGHTDSLEVAVRRAAVTGVNQTALRLQDTFADEMGCDLVETTAHGGARPDHAEWQGQIFSRSGKSKQYKDFRSATGYGTGAGLGGWNCRHSFNPYFEGSPRTYSKELLESYDAKNIEYNGQMLTEYEAGQQQRQIERNIRRWKRENVATQAAGLDTTESAAKIKQWQDTQKDFVKQTGLKRQAAREQVGGYGKSEAGKAASIAKTLAAKANGAYNLGSTTANVKAYQGDQRQRDVIRSDQQPKSIESGKQGKHILGHNNYTAGRSYLSISEQEAQALVDRYAGTGTLLRDASGRWANKEFISSNREVGVSVGLDGSEVKTKQFIIHYSKKGTHIVPTTRKE